MIETVSHGNKLYPKFQASHNSARFVIAFAIEVCKGMGFDIGAGKREWSLPGSMVIDPAIEQGYDAMNLPEGASPDYIFSSHCLEHLDKWVDVLDYWTNKLKKGGTLFLYLPDHSQTYWRPWNNRKHVSCFTPDIIRNYLSDTGNYTKIFVSGVDLNNSFVAMAEKA